MNVPEQPLAVDSPNTSGLEDLQRSFRALRSLWYVVAVAFLMLSGSLSVFLLRETIVVRRQVDELVQYVANYEKNSYPVMLEFREKLEVFARSHPDFRPILGRYVSLTNLAGSPVEGGTNLVPSRLPVIPDE